MLSMHAIVSTPGTRRLLAVSVFARLPLPMLGIALLVHVHHLTGSFAVAGLVDGAYAAALGVGGPVLGRLVDRRGQTAVLLGSALGAAAALVALALAPRGAPVPALLALAAALGLSAPPLGACTRTLLPALLSDPAQLRTAFALDATAVELTWIAGPPLALGVAAMLSTGAALATAGLILLGGTAAFAAQRSSRAWRPARRGDAGRGAAHGGALRSPAMRTLVLVLTAVGFVFGASEVAIAAAAADLGNAAASGPLLGIWGVGSLIGGLVASRLGGGARTAAGLALVLAALAAGHLALAAATGSVLTLAAVLLAAGAAIAPTYATVYAMVDGAAPEGTATEAFAWIATAAAIGSAFGSAAAGPVAQSIGPSAAFVLAGAAGGLATLIVTLRSCSLTPRRAEATA